MRLMRALPAWLLLWLLAAPLHAADRLFITPLDAEGMSELEKRIVSEGLLSRVVAYDAFELISDEAMQAIVSQQKQQALLDDSCLGDNSCLTSLGRLLNTQLMLRPRAFVVDSEITVTLELIDVAAGRILSKQEYRANQPLRSLSPDFDSVMDRIVRPLKLTGMLTLQGAVPGSSLTVQKRAVALGSDDRLQIKLPIGTYGLELTHPAYVPLSTRIFVPVSGYEWTPEQISLADARRKWYKTWWFWTSVLAGATAGGIGTYYAVKPEDPPVAPGPYPKPYGSVTVRF